MRTKKKLMKTYFQMRVTGVGGARDYERLELVVLGAWVVPGWHTLGRRLLVLGRGTVRRREGRRLPLLSFHATMLRELMWVWCVGVSFELIWVRFGSPRFGSVRFDSARFGWFVWFVGRLFTAGVQWARR